MTALTLADYQDLLAAPTHTSVGGKAASVSINGRIFDMTEVNSGEVGAAPGAAVVPPKSFATALHQPDAPSGQSLYVLSVGYDYSEATIGTTNGVGGTVMLVDRLSHNSGMSAATATTQTTNLPTAALTRYTNGVGVMAAWYHWGSTGGGGGPGATATTATISYTNDAGTAGRTGNAFRIGGTNFQNARNMYMIPTQAGDRGIRSIESFTLAATTGSAGNIGFVLFKPLLVATMGGPGDSYVRTYLNGGLGGGIPAIEDGACLQWWLFSNSGGSANFMHQTAFGAI